MLVEVQGASLQGLGRLLPPSVMHWRQDFGTTSGHLRERKFRRFPYKRHQTKLLGFLAPMIRDQEVGGSNPLAPTNFFKILPFIGLRYLFCFDGSCVLCTNVGQ